MAGSSLKFSKIFVVIDPTRLVQPSLLRAEAIARLNRARIVLYCCIPGEPSSDPSTPANLEVVATREWLERIAEVGRSRDADMTVEVECNTNWRQALVEASARSGCDLIVKTSSQHSLVGRLFSATADWMLLRSATSPVLLVTHAGTKVGAQRRLLAAIKLKPEDPGHEQMNARIVDLAHYLATVAGFEMHAVTAYRGDEVFYDRQAFADSCRLPRNQVHASEGAPQHGIAAVAAEIGADTIVIGNPGDSETARRLIDQVEADVLVLPSDSD
jgi:nucleotide-binding universal stress UspA family protein